jgi:hypothetical protein
MQTTNNFAFKEWAAICSALGEGLQTLIIRKGGIDEGREGFRVAHDEFWLFPTYVHEAAAGLEPDALPLLNRAEVQRPPPGTVHLGHYAIVTDVFHVLDQKRLMCLAGQHVWSPRTVGERFAYRRPGLFVLIVRVYVVQSRMLFRTRRTSPAAVPGSICRWNFRPTSWRRPWAATNSNVAAGRSSRHSRRAGARR